VLRLRLTTTELSRLVFHIGKMKLHMGNLSNAEDRHSRVGGCWGMVRMHGVVQSMTQNRYRETITRKREAGGAPSTPAPLLVGMILCARHRDNDDADAGRYLHILLSRSHKQG